MATTFNLITESWIPVLKNDGSVTQLSIKEVFESAHDIKDLACELPTLNVAVFRTLFAIFRRSLDEDMLEDPYDYWAELWDAEALPTAEIEHYLGSVMDRFDLLDPEKPFMQTAGLHTSKGEWKELGILIADSPGEGSLFIQSNPDAELDYATAAQWLIHAHSFDYSGIKSGAVGDDRVKNGKGYPMGIGWAGWLGCTLIKGTTLKETLLLNYVQPGFFECELDEDLPIWEQEPLTSAAQKHARVVGQIGLLTWPQRRILLHNSGSGIDKVLVTNGDPIDYLAQYDNETMTPWRYSEPQTKKAKRHIYMPKTLSAGEALWRGLQSLLPQGQISYITVEQRNSSIKDKLPRFMPPHTIVELANRIGNPLPRDYHIKVDVTSMEYGSQSASFKTVVHDTLTFPALLATIDGKGLRDIAEIATDRALTAAKELGLFAANVRRAEVNSKESPELAANKAKTVAYSLIDQRLREWLSKLSISEADAQQQLQEWTDWLRTSMFTESQRIAHEASPTAWTGRKITHSNGESSTLYTVGMAEVWFRKRLWEALPSAQATTEGE